MKGKLSKDRKNASSSEDDSYSESKFCSNYF